MTVRQSVILVIPEPLVLFLLPLLKARIIVHYSCDFARIEALAAAASAEFTLTMDQPDLAERLPGVFSRSEGSLSFISSALRFLLIDVSFDDFLWTFIKLMFEAGDRLLQSSQLVVVFQLLRANKRVPQIDVGTICRHFERAVSVAFRTGEALAILATTVDLLNTNVPRTLATGAYVIAM